MIEGNPNNQITGIVHLMIQSSVLFFLLGCKNQETKYIYFDKAEKHVRAKAEYVDGKAHGKVKEYYKNGTVRANTDYKYGKMDGTHELYLPNGILESRSYFSDGVLQEVERFDSLKQITRVDYYSPSGAIYNSVFFNPDRSAQDLQMRINIAKDRPVNVNEKFKFDVRLVNVSDAALLRGVLRVGSNFEKRTLVDTLLEVPSEKNLYEFEVIAKPGAHKIAAQLDVNHADTALFKDPRLFFFLYAEYECPSEGRCKITSLPLPQAFHKSN
jgi:antitoxin component YwqK of YwqJK toxin-antitoxin module